MTDRGISVLYVLIYLVLIIWKPQTYVIHLTNYSYFYTHFSAEIFFTSALRCHEAAVQGPILLEFARVLYSITYINKIHYIAMT